MDKFLKIIDDEHKRLRGKRAGRLEAIGAYKIDVTTNQMPHKAWGYIKEAENNFIYSSFRSCIFACAAVMEQIFKAEYIRNSEDKDEARKTTMGIGLKDLIHKCKDIEFLKPVIDQAHWLRNIRNDIGVHTLSVEVPEPSDNDAEKKRKNKSVIDDLLAMEKYLSKTEKKRFAGAKIKYSNNKDKVIVIPLSQVLSFATSMDLLLELSTATEWMLYRLSMKSYLNLKNMIETLFPVDTTRHNR